MRGQGLGGPQRGKDQTTKTQALIHGAVTKPAAPGHKTELQIEGPKPVAHTLKLLYSSNPIYIDPETKQEQPYRDYSIYIITTIIIILTKTLTKAKRQLTKPETQ